MNFKSKRMLTLASVLFLFVMLLSGFHSFAQETMAIEIQVSPATLNLQNQGSWVTVHTDIAYSAVLGASVTLNGVPINWSKSDNQGNFVAKFVIGEIKGLESLEVGDYNTLTLSGTTKAGVVFSGSAEVMVIDVTGKL